MLDILYAQAAAWRRRAVDRQPDRRRRLSGPVISIGNLSVGGTGKTPVVAAVTRWLVERGERPAILSRGYRRRLNVPGVVVVSDGKVTRAGLDRSGDEPLMLARAVPEAVVCVSEDRYLAGVLAERALGATVHVLDDGFQHVKLARDLDVLVTAPGEIPDGRVLPFGRLRESPAAAAHAHVLVVIGATADAAAIEAGTLGVTLACGASRRLGEPVPVGTVTTGDATSEGPPGRRQTESLAPGSRVVVACGIANPGRFVEDVKAAGWSVTREAIFADHHAFSAGDIRALAEAVTRTEAVAVVTTDKDAVRFEDVGARPFPLYRLPLTLTFEPPDVLFDRVQAVLRRHDSEGGRHGASR